MTDINTEVKDLVDRIVADSSAYADLKGQLEEIDDSSRNALLELLSDKNPPLLGTGGTS